MMSPFCNVLMLASPTALLSNLVLGFTRFSNSSSSSGFGLVMRYPKSWSCKSTTSGISASQVSFSFVFLKSPVGFSSPSSAVIVPSADLTIFRMKQFPQSMRVTSSPSATACASTCSSHNLDDLVVALSPAPGYFLCLGTIITSGSSGPFVSVMGTRASVEMAVCRGQTGSIIRLLMDQILSHSCRVTFFEAPCETMNSCSAWIVMPRRTTPWTVGKRGSFQPSTRPVSTNHVSLRLERTVYWKLSRA
mmetsp:Transcript_23036/g.40898  ORF Transcript_23036/g.40898 Transcript_23036/m.40898 type:complete len:248 (-) Transcript_23036:1408-2151(-)